MTRSQAALDKCIALNNDAAVMIQANVLVKSIETLTSALRLCRQFSTGKHACRCPRPHLPEPPRFDIDVLLTPKKPPDHTDEPTESDHGYIYQHPVLLPSLLGSCCCCHAAYVIGLIISFNLGLAHHLWALQCKNGNGEPSLTKALQFYKAAQNFLRRRCRSSKVVFQIAVTNNIARILHLLGNFEASGKYFRTQLSLILYMTQYKKADSQLYEEYLRNALPDTQPYACAA